MPEKPKKQLEEPPWEIERQYRCGEPKPMKITLEKRKKQLEELL